MSSGKGNSVSRLLPLPPASFHILLAVAEGDRHGYVIIRDVENRTGGQLRLSAGTLYRSIHRLVGQGLLTETTHSGAYARDHERRRYYRITALGKRVANAEATRLSQLIRLARTRGLEPETA